MRVTFHALSDARAAGLRGLACLALAASGLGLGACTPGERFDRPTPDYHAEVVNPELVDGLIIPENGVMLAWGSDGSILRATDPLQWRPALSPSTADLVRGATADGVTLVVGEQGSILRSEDSGQTWQAVGEPQPDVRLQAVAYDSQRKVWIAAGTQGVITRSADGGKTWKSQRAARPIKLESLYYDADSQSLWLGGEQGLIGRSSDGGENWILQHMPIDTPVAGFQRYGKTLLARSGLGRLLHTDDNGKQWQVHQLASKGFFTDSARDPVSGAIVVSNHLGEVARSTDGGHNWRLIQTEFGGRRTYLSAIRFDESSRTLVAVGHQGSMLRSVDGGLRWEEALPPGIPVSFATLIYDPARKTMAVPGKGGYMLGSQNAGEVWQTALVGLPEYQRDALFAAQGSAVVTTGEVGSLYRGNGQAMDWLTPDITYPDPSTPPAYRALVTGPDGQTLLAAGPPGTIMRSTDAGETWQAVHAAKLEQGEAIVQLLVDRERKLVIALDAFGALKISTDNGQTWTARPVSLDGREIWHGALSRNGHVVAVGSKGLILRGSPGGGTWQVTESGFADDLYGAWCETRGKQCFALGKGGTVLRSSDEGASWSRAHAGGEAALRRMIEEPREHALLAFGEKGVILRSTDGGKSWQSMASGTTAELRAAAIEPGTGHVLIVGAAGTLLRSSDGGQQWQALPTHTARHLRNLAFNPQDGNLLLVGERIVRLQPSTPHRPR